MASSPSDVDPNAVAVLVPAAGAGRRMGGERKQFRTLGERPLLVQSLFPFERHPGVGHVIVAAPEGEVESVSDRLQSEGITGLTAVVSGGDSRRASVRHALRAVPDPVEMVLVHDAVRPFVSEEEVDALVEAVDEDGAASLAIPVVDTLRRGSDGTFGETVSRDGLYRMQTPQGFRRAWLERAHRVAAEVGTAATDDVELVQEVGHDVHIVRGSRRNFKVTTPEDWALAQQLWPAWVGRPEEA